MDRVYTFMPDYLYFEPIIITHRQTLYIPPVLRMYTLRLLLHWFLPNYIYFKSITLLISHNLCLPFDFYHITSNLCLLLYWFLILSTLRLLLYRFLLNYVYFIESQLRSCPRGSTLSGAILMSHLPKHNFRIFFKVAKNYIFKSSGNTWRSVKPCRLWRISLRLWSSCTRKGSPTATWSPRTSCACTRTPSAPSSCAISTWALGSSSRRGCRTQWPPRCWSRRSAARSSWRPRS